MRSIVVFLALGLSGCVGTTGGELFEVDAYASGPEGLVPGASYEFANGHGYDVRLDRARMHVGAIYLNRSRPTSVAADTSCTLAGVYVAEVTEGVEVDLLSPELQPFPRAGVATSEHASTGEVWLSHGDVNAASSSRSVLELAGEAARGAERYPFSARLSIGQNRVIPPTSAAQPGSNPICKQRIVTPVPVELALAPGHSLILRVDPARFFANVEFSTLAPSPTEPDRYEFADARHENQASDNLYAGLRGTPAYRFEVEPLNP